MQPIVIKREANVKGFAVVIGGAVIGERQVVKHFQTVDNDCTLLAVIEANDIKLEEADEEQAVAAATKAHIRRSILQASLWAIIVYITVALCVQPVIAIRRQLFQIKHVSFAALCALFILQFAVFWLTWAIITVLVKRCFAMNKNGNVLSIFKQKFARIVIQRLHAEMKEGRGILLWWYRLLGANIHSSANLGINLSISDPELMTVGAHSLLDGAALFTAAHEDTTLSEALICKQITIKEAAFVGQKAWIEGGVTLGRVIVMFYY